MHNRKSSADKQMAVECLCLWSNKKTQNEVLKSNCRIFLINEVENKEPRQQDEFINTERIKKPMEKLA